MATKTSLAESSQAFFCALGDYALIKKGEATLKDIFDLENYKNFTGFTNHWVELFPNKQDDPQIIYEKFTATGISTNLPYNEIFTFLTENKDWYTSSVKIADKFIKDINKIPQLKNFTAPSTLTSTAWYYRGDSEVMGNISKLFSIANKNDGNIFGDLNKWSPADIYYAKEVAKKAIQTQYDYYKVKANIKSFHFINLNELINGLIKSGDLLPISLKKQTKTVNIYPINFNKQEEAKELLKFEFKKLRQPWKKSTVKNPQTRDIQLQITDNPKDYIQIRHDASNGEKSDGFKSEIFSGTQAKGGGIASLRIFVDVFSKIDSAQAEIFRKAWDTGSKKYQKIMEPKREKLEKDLKRAKSEAAKKIIKKDYDDDRSLQSALNVTNNVFPDFIAWIQANNQSPDEIKGKGKTTIIIFKSDSFVQEMYRYIASMSPDSGEFVILK